MNWTEIGILYRRELRSAFRERSIVVNGILLPIFLYPVLLWGMFTALTFVQGVNEGFTSRIAVDGPPPPGHQALLDTLAAREDVEVVGGAGAGEDAPPPERWEEALAAGELDAILSFREVDGPGGTDGSGSPADGEGAGVRVAADSAPPAPGALPGNFSVQLRYDEAEERSRQARTRVQEILGEYRSAWLAREGRSLGLSDEERTVFALVGENVSTSEEIGQVLLGQMLSLFLIIMVALGCYVPSVDTTAGERERSTWETMMTLSASRLSIVTAKYLYVATLGIVAGLLNVVALMVSVGAVIRPLTQGNEEAISFSIPWMAVPVMMAGAVALALFFAAAMMMLAAFARSFKDGQALAAPVYYLVFIPFLLGDQTDTNLSLATALVPIANVAMMIRDAIGGVFLWPWIGVTLAVTLALVGGCILLARQILRFEEFLLGGFDGSFWRFAKEKLFA
jgi:sodium transport system permease protein